MILFQEKPADKIREDRETIKKKRHQLHVMMSSYCTINCNTEEAEDRIFNTDKHKDE